MSSRSKQQKRISKLIKADYKIISQYEESDHPTTATNTKQINPGDAKLAHYNGELIAYQHIKTTTEPDPATEDEPAYIIRVYRVTRSRFPGKFNIKTVKETLTEQHTDAIPYFDLTQPSIIGPLSRISTTSFDLYMSCTNE